jgi:hypothetical protein
MHNQLNFHNKQLDVHLSDTAAQQSHLLSGVLLVEIQIYFSCMLGKRLAFYTDQPIEGTWQLDKTDFSNLLKSAQPVTDNIYVRFNAVMTKACSVSDYAGPPPVTDFDIPNKTPYVPCWLRLDFSHGLWSGEYGWHNSDSTHSNTKQIRGAAIRNETAK